MLYINNYLFIRLIQQNNEQPIGDLNDDDVIKEEQRVKEVPNTSAVSVCQARKIYGGYMKAVDNV